VRSVALLVAFALGLPAGRAFPGAFRLLFRAQLAALTSTLALFVGWSASFGATALTGLGVLLGGEVAALGLGTLLLHRGMTTAPAVASSVSNSGFWSIPVAGALFGPAGAAFAVLYDVVSVPRAVLVTKTLRAYAPCRPSGRSAAVDYLPQAALVTGLGLRALSNPPAVVDLLPAAGVAVGVVGFFLLGMAMPQCLPVRADWRDALPAVALRFGVTTSLCLAFQVGGVDVPAAVWVLALAPSPFSVVSMGNLYGYGKTQTAAIPLLTVPLAVALVPVAAWLGP
jgi:predicted permease